MSRKHTYEEIKTYIESYGYTLLSTEYKNNKQKLDMLCDHNHEIHISYHDFSTGHRCPYCSKNIISENDVKVYLNEFGYELIGEYKNTNSKAWFKCPKGHIIDMTFGRFKAGHRCRECQHGQKNKYEDIKNYFASYGYTLVGDYKRRDEKLELICPSGHEIKISYDCFRKGVRCCKCNGSNGEKEIMSFLDKNSVCYEPQYPFEDCRDKQPLPFDIYLPMHNICIEYQGKQHYEPINFGGCSDEQAIENFKIIQLHDKIKMEYCKTHNIQLIQIPYWHFNDIEKILKENKII